MIRNSIITIIIYLIIGCTAGCTSAWRPGLEHLMQSPGKKDFSLNDYLVANRSGYWIYQRRDVPVSDNQQPVRYTRKITANRSSEGNLVHSHFLPLCKYLLPIKGPTTQPAENKRPAAPFPNGMAAFVKLENPMVAVPENLQPNIPISNTSDINYYDYLGKIQTRGTLTREVEIEGFEDVESPAGKFERCMRVRIDFTAKFSWILTVNWTSYLWLSPEIGEVRRVHAFSGAWFFIFWFHSAHEYRLVDYYKPPLQPETFEQLSPKWECIALIFDRGIPKPQISGMVVDYATSRPGP